MPARFYIVEGRPLDIDGLTDEQTKQVKAFLTKDIRRRKQDEYIAYYADHTLENDLADCPPVVKEFLARKIAENGGGMDVQLGI